MVTIDLCARTSQICFFGTLKYLSLYFISERRKYFDKFRYPNTVNEYFRYHLTLSPIG